MPRFDDLLRQVFERKGYAVELGRTVSGASGASYHVPLYARHASGDLLVLWKTDAAVTAEDVNALAFAVNDARVAGAVVVSTADTNAAPPAGTRVDVWPLSRAALEVGTSVLRAALEAEGHWPPKQAGQTTLDAAAAPAVPVAAPAPAAAPTHSGAYIPPAKFRSLVATAVATTRAGQDPNVYLYKTKPRPRPSDEEAAKPLAYAWGGSAAAAGSPTHSSVAQIRRGRPRPAPEPAPAAPAARTPIIAPEDSDVELVTTPRRRGARPPAAEAPAPAPAPAPPPAPVEAPPRAASPPPPPAPAWNGPPAPPQTTAVRLDRERAVAAAGSRVGTVRHARLTLVPHLAFDYDAWVDHDALPEPLAGRGAVLVNALTGHVRTGEAVVFASSLPEAADAPPAPRYQAVDVYEKVKGTLTKQFSRELKVSREIGGNEVYENVRVVPALPDLGLEHRGVVNAPVWVVEGDTGTVRVDATTGAIIE